MRCWQGLFHINREHLTDAVWVVISLILLTLLAHTAGYPSLNLSESLDGRLYWVFPHPHSLKTGDVVVFRFKGSSYFPRGALFIKRIACLPGQKLIERNRCFTCNGRPLGCAKERDRKGNPAPLFKWNGIIPAQKYFVMGTDRDSYDSRYWGFVDRSAIRGIAYKIF